jgi:predicted MFS family arabinose efflux permease
MHCAGDRWIVLAALFSARAATGCQFQAVGSSATMLMSDLGVDYAQLGMLMGAYLLPGIIVAFPAGLLGQRFTEETLGLISLALMAISAIGLAYANSIIAALIARMVGGAGATILVLVATKMIADLFEEREILLAMSLLQMSWPFGAMLALPIQTLIAQVWGWPSVMVSAAVCAFAALCALALAPRSPGRPSRSAPARAKIPRAMLGPVIIAGIIWGAMNLACILFFSYAPLLMVARGASPSTAASLTGLAIWLTIMAIPSGGYLLQRIGKPIAAILCCGPIAALALLCFVVGVYPTTCCMIFGIAVGPLSGAILSLPSQILPLRHRSVGFGVFFTCF